MSGERKKILIGGVEYEREGDGRTERFSRMDHKNSMLVVNVFSSNPESGYRMKAFKRSVASFLCKND